MKTERPRWEVTHRLRGVGDRIERAFNFQAGRKRLAVTPSAIPSL
jgi:hypothetical protein